MRLLIVSNRLPISAVEKEGKLEFQESVGGLVTGLSAYLDSLKSSSFVKPEHIWVGWPGIAVSDKIKESVKSKLLTEFNCYPIFISKKDIEKFYYGFCNKTIWPLFHYFPSFAVYDIDYWSNYKKVNKLFCSAVTEIIQPDDVVWIQDYHLMLLPKLLREKIQNPVGFFLHIPFPTFEIFRLLPTKWRTEILTAFLAADLLGFHTHDYTQDFLRCVLRILGYEHSMGEIAFNGHIVKVDTFPMGIDFTRFYTAQNREDVKKEKEALFQSLGGYKVILSVDRLDYTKGILNRLYAYKIFLEKNPQWHKKVALILVVVPSRIGVEHYKQMKKQVDEVVGEINGRFGDINWTPILYQFKYLPFHQLVPLYSVSDVCLVTPLRDGMNLVAKEYIASRTDKTGVLVLSEMAGASKELREAIIINPNNIEEIADALKLALEISEEEQIKRNQVMQRRLEFCDVINWANNFIEKLLLVKEKQKGFNAKLLTINLKKQLINDYNKAKARLLLLDYDGTLVPFSEDPQTVKPDEMLFEILKTLSEDPRNNIVIISGRDKGTLENWFGTLNIGLVAEHGAWIKDDNEWMTIKPLKNEWKPKIIPILEMYSDMLPGAFVEEKEFSVVWHYRKAEPEISSILAKDLVDNLVNFTANIDLQVLKGNKVVEIKNSGVDKGFAALYWIAKKDFDFVLAIGDDWTDEDMFISLKDKNVYTIKVEIIASSAKYNVYSYRDVTDILKGLINA